MIKEQKQVNKEKEINCLVCGGTGKQKALVEPIVVYPGPTYNEKGELTSTCRCPSCTGRCPECKEEHHKCKCKNE